MLVLEQFLPFLLAAVLLTLAPGPDNLMVLSLGMSGGRRQGLAFGLGCATGCISHTLLAVFGVSALIAAAPGAFASLRTIGGLYLFWLGIQTLRQAGTHGPKRHSPGNESTLKWFIRGILANAVNPKVMMFFLAFLPQFVVPEQGDVALQMALLGLVFTLQGALIFGLLGHFSGSLGQKLSQNPRLGLWINRLAALVLIALGLRLLALG